MVLYTLGGRGGTVYPLEIASGQIVVRTHGIPDLAQAVASTEGQRLLQQAVPVAAFPDAHVVVLDLQTGDEKPTVRRDQARRVLAAEPQIRFAGRVLQDSVSGAPVVYSENFFVKFQPDLDAAACRRFLRRYGLEVKERLPYSKNGYFVAAAEGSGLEIFALAAEMLAAPEVLLCHPELIRPLEVRGSAVASIPHLERSLVGAGRGKTAPRVALIGSDAVMSHVHRAAPTVLPLKLAAGLGSKAEADVLFFAVQQGSQVIVCTWGPHSGDWRNPYDRRRDQPTPMSDMTREAVDYALTRGRDGRGCVVVWAVGRGGAALEQDGYANQEAVIAAAPCTPAGTRLPGMDYGTALWGCAPVEGDTDNAPALAALTVGEAASRALAENPQLSAREIKTLLRHAAQPVDIEGGSYGVDGHSPFYGYGRVDVEAAVKLARGLTAPNTRLDDGAPRFLALTFQVLPTPQWSASALARRIVAEELGRTTWRVQPVPFTATEFDAFYRGRSPITVARAWELAYALRARREVVYAEPSFLLAVPGETDLPPVDKDVQPDAVAPRAFFANQPHLPATDNDFEWSLTQVQAQTAWTLSPAATGKARGEGILIGHPDSGFIAHPELDAARLRLDLAKDFIDVGTSPEDPGGHHGLGTGSVIMSGDNRPPNARFVSGAAPLAELIPLRVTQDRPILPSPILLPLDMLRLRDAIRYAVDAGCHVISMSLGGLPGSTPLHNAIQEAVAAGVIVLAAAGNYVGVVVFPALYDEVIAVAASNIERKPWRYTSVGSAVDITAPGESVWTATVDTAGTPTTHRSSGTSFAVATMAGIAALWLAHHGRDALLAQYGAAGLASVFKEVMMRHGADPGPSLPPDKLGAGIANAVKLLQAPLPPTPPARGMRAFTPRAVSIDQDKFELFRALFEDVPVSALRSGLLALLQTDEAHLPGVLAEVGDELAFHLITDPQLYARLAAAFPQPEPKLAAAPPATPAPMQSVRRRLTSPAASSQLAALVRQP